MSLNVPYPRSNSLIDVSYYTNERLSDRKKWI
jgi:hypothetical protein